MLTREEWTRKWLLYTLAAALFLILQSVLFQRLTIWGVMPFLYPLLAVIPATYEEPSDAAGFALALGVLCDLVLPGSTPCFYTLLFPCAAVIASLFAKRVLPAGFLCSLVVSAVTFAFHGLFHCLVLNGNTPVPIWRAGAWLTFRETAVTLPLLFPVTLLFQLVARVTHADD